MSTVEQTARERQLEGICESQRLELEDARAAMRRWETPRARAEPESAGAIQNSNATSPDDAAAHAYVDARLAVVDDLVRRLQAATELYRGRRLYPGDVSSMERVRGHLAEAVNGLIRPAQPPS